MRFTILPTVLLSATAVFGAAVEKRDARSVLSSMTAAVSSANTLNSQLSSFGGDLITGLGVLMQSEDLVTKVNQVITNARSSTTFSATDSSQVATALTGQLGPALEQNARTLVAKKEVFRASFRGVTLGQLINTKAQTKVLFDTVQSKLALANAASVSAFGTRLLQVVEDAIVVYEQMRPPVREAGEAKEGEAKAEEAKEEVKAE